MSPVASVTCWKLPDMSSRETAGQTPFDEASPAPFFASLGSRVCCCVPLESSCRVLLDGESPVRPPGSRFSAGLTHHVFVFGPTARRCGASQVSRMTCSVWLAARPLPLALQTQPFSRRERPGSAADTVKSSVCRVFFVLLDNLLAVAVPWPTFNYFRRNNQCLAL